jgi:hypothetical protein
MADRRAVWAVWKGGDFALHTVLAGAVILVWFSCYRYKEDRLVSSALPFVAVIAAIVLTKAAARLRPRLRVAALGCVLAGLFIWHFLVVRPVFEQRFTLGYPSFLAAMEFLREHATPGAVVLGANYPQIHWYSGLRAIDFPEGKKLPEALRNSEWVVITSFEPGQKTYVSVMARRLMGAPSKAGRFPQGTKVFRDNQYVTIVMPSALLLPVATP